MSALIISGTALFSFTGFIFALCLPVTDGRTKRIWFFSWLLLTLHTVAAFHFVHNWSHQHALVETARQTRDLTGIDWEGGVFLNYLIILMWGADCLLMHLESVFYSAWQRRFHRSTIICTAFMWFNGTVVFGGPFASAIGVLAFSFLGWRYVTGRSSRKPLVS